MRVLLAVACVLLIGCGQPRPGPTLGEVIAGLPVPDEIELGPPAPPDHLTIEYVNRADLQGRLVKQGADFTPCGRRLVLDAAYVTASATLYICFEYGDGPYERIDCGDGVLFVHEEWSL